MTRDHTPPARHAAATAPAATAADREGNLAVARRYFEDIWCRGDLAAVEAIIASDVAGHVNGRTFHGRETLKQRLAALWSTYGQPHFAIDDLVADGDRVVARWSFVGAQTGPYLGRPASGRRVSVTGMNLFRLSGGRVAELWVNADDLGELEQLGLVTVPAA
jgi:steroid delta-isomerase-like uncharacterized protein